jgi:hypothetical protein
MAVYLRCEVGTLLFQTPYEKRVYPQNVGTSEGDGLRKNTMSTFILYSNKGCQDLLLIEVLTFNLCPANVENRVSSY